MLAAFNYLSNFFSAPLYRPSCFSMLAHRSAVASAESPGFDFTGLGLSVWNIHVLPMSGYSSSLQSKDWHVRLIGGFKLALGINGCLFHCVIPMTDWRPVQAVLPFVLWQLGKAPTTVSNSSIRYYKNDSLRACCYDLSCYSYLYTVYCSAVLFHSNSLLNAPCFCHRCYSLTMTHESNCSLQVYQDCICTLVSFTWTHSFFKCGLMWLKYKAVMLSCTNTV